MSVLYAIMVVAIVLDHAHLVCPITLAWGHRRFRAYMLEQWDKFVLLPALFIAISLAVGGASEVTRSPGFRAMAVTYFVWNAWHFASQNYGISALSGGKPWQRNAAFSLTVICVLGLPVLWGQILWIVLADLGISVMHWIMDLRLSSYMVQRQWLFTIAMLLIGLSGFAFKTVEPGTLHHCGPLLVCTASWSVPILLSLRYGLGFWHFLMSRWVWSSEGRALLSL